ncbi:hypothetical protein [Microbacterium sediminicola]
MLGIVTGATATVLLAWAVLSSNVSGVPSPPQLTYTGAFAPDGSAAMSDALTPVVPTVVDEVPAENDHSYELRAGRVVPAVPNAKQVEPQYQLQTNLGATAYEICVGLNAYRAANGAFPETLSVVSDGHVVASDTQLTAVLPAYMRLSYVSSAPEGTAFLTVADAESGMAMSCIQSGSGGWITNS